MAALVTALVFASAALIYQSSANIYQNPCRSFCGNVTIDYPFGVRYGCGHPGFRDLLFCINEVLMFHISSGSYRVLEIDYSYKTLIIQEPHLSTFAIEKWRSPYLAPTPDTVFILIGCSPSSRLFSGYSLKHLPCRNVSGMGCEDYMTCPAWDSLGYRSSVSGYGSGPPECCAVSFDSVMDVNLTELGCEGYSSAYSLAPVRPEDPREWSYGIRVKYSAQRDEKFCRACEASGGACGFSSDEAKAKPLCICGGFNSTSSCDVEDYAAIATKTWINAACLNAGIFLYGLMLMTGDIYNFFS